MKIFNPGKSFLKQAFLQTLIGVLCLNVAVPAALWADINSDISQSAIPRLATDLADGSNVGDPNAPSFAIIAGQKIVDSVSGTVTDLNRPDINLVPVGYTDFQRDVGISWNASRSEVYFKVGTKTAVISGIRVTGDPIFSSGGDYLYIPTDQGIRTLIVKNFNQYGFTAPVALYLTTPLPSQLGTIVKLTVHERGTARSVDPNLPAILGKGDLSADVVLPDGSTKTVHFDLETNQSNLAVQMVGVIVEMILENPQAEEIEAYSKFLRENDALVKKYKDQRAVFIGSDNNSLTFQAIRRMAERSGLTAHTALLNEVLQVTKASRDRFPADPNQMLATTRMGLMLDPANPPAEGAQVKAAAEFLDGIQFTGNASKKSYTARFSTSVFKIWNWIASPKRLLGLGGILAGGTAYSFYQPDSFLGRLGAPSVRAVSSIWNGILASPFTHLVADPKDLHNAVNYILDQSHTLATAGGIALMSFGIYFGTVLLGYGAGWVRHWVSGRAAPNGDFSGMNRALMETMRDGYLLANRGIEGIVAFLFGQRNLFNAMAAGIPAGNPNAWNLPHHPTQIEAGRQALNQTIEDQSQLRAASLDLASAILISEATRTPLPVLLGSAQFAGEYTLGQLVGTPDGLARLSELMVTSQIVLAEMQENTDLTLDPRAMKVRLEKYAQIAATIQARAAQDPALLGSLSRVGAACKEFFSGQVLPVLLGKNGLALFRRYYGTTIHPEVQNQADHMYKVDYTSSQIMLGVFSAGSPAGDMSFPVSARLRGGAAEQVLNTTAQLPNDIAPKIDNRSLQNGNAPIGGKLFDESTRAQTLFEALGTLLTGWVHENADEDGLFDFWHNWIGNMRDGWFVRTLMATAGMAIVFAGKMHEHKIAFSGPTDFLWTSTSTAWVWLMQKMSVGWDPTSGAHLWIIPGTLLVGYATVWPQISKWLKGNASTMGKNLAKTQSAAGKIWQGGEIEDIQLMQEGVREMKELYASNGRDLPDELNSSSGEYTVEKALKLLAYARRVAPLPTGESKTFYILLNFVWGAGLSTILYNMANVDLTTHPPSVLRLATTFACITGCYFGSKFMAKKVVNPGIKALQPKAKGFLAGLQGIKSLCARTLLGRNPVNTQ